MYIKYHPQNTSCNANLSKVIRAEGKKFSNVMHETGSYNKLPLTCFDSHCRRGVVTSIATYTEAVALQILLLMPLDVYGCR